jgi:3-hydroxyacyl-[acyl-carrier-protein] dehydratase
MPQMLLVEALAQTAGVLCHFSGLLDGPGRPLMLLAGVDDCHFGRDARPGDQLRLECRMHRLIRGIVKMTGDILIDEELALKARLTAATRQTI